MLRPHHWTLAALTLTLAACGGRPAPAPPAPRAMDSAAQVVELGRLVERYWSDAAALAPWYSWGGIEIRFGETPLETIAPQSLADALSIERRYLAELLAMPRANLDEHSKLTYDVFRLERSLTIEGLTFPAELAPVDPYGGMAVEFALMAPEAQRVALSSARNFDAWRTRTQSFVRWTKQAVANMRDGMRRGYTTPRVLVERSLPELAALGEDTPANPFRRAAAAEGSGEERVRLTAAMSTILNDEVLPAYRSLHDFLQREYLPRARTSIGLSALPLGDAWYAYAARRATGSAATPAQLHQLGAAEVEHVRQRLQSLLSETAFSGDARGFLERMRRDPRFAYEADKLPDAYRELKGQVAMSAQALFSRMPRADVDIRAVEVYRAPLAPIVAYRARSPNGLLSARLVIGTAERDAHTPLFAPAQFLREAVPGKHYQLELQHERTDLPRFRRFGGAPAFIEGWGLYAATLGEEMGLYRDPESKFGVGLAELTCALGLVIDTGIHGQNWTRQQALEYVRAQSPLEEAAAADLVDRAIAQPGAATACTVGFLRIQALRSLAQQKLGTAFDVRAFHAQVIEDGAVPLDLLESKIKSWLASGATAAPVAGSAAPELD